MRRCSHIFLLCSMSTDCCSANQGPLYQEVCCSLWLLAYARLLGVAQSALVSPPAVVTPALAMDRFGDVWVSGGGFSGLNWNNRLYRFNVTDIYWVGGFGNDHYIGWVAANDYVLHKI